MDEGQRSTSNIGADGLSSLRAAGDQMFDTTQRVGSTLIDQAAHNTMSFFEMMSAAAAAKTMPDAVAVQADYACAQTARSFEQMCVLAEAVTKTES